MSEEYLALLNKISIRLGKLSIFLPGLSSLFIACPASLFFVIVDFEITLEVVPSLFFMSSSSSYALLISN